MKHKIRKLREFININFFKSSLPNLIVYKRVHIGLEKDYKIINNGRLHLGRTYNKNGFLTSFLTLREGSKLKINGIFNIMSGFRITVENNAILEIGSGNINYGANIACFNNIKIGNNVEISENVTIRDSDNHEILHEGFQMSKPIEICDHVWIGVNVTILKGVTIGEGAVISAGSVVTKDVPPHCLAVGLPARVVKQNIEWR